MKRMLTGKEKLYSIIITVAYLLLTLFIAVQLTGGLSLVVGELSAEAIVVGMFVFIIGLILGAGFLHILVGLLGPKQDPTFGFTFYLYILANLIVNVFSSILSFAIGIARYVAYENVWGYVESFLYVFIIAYLLYKYGIHECNKVIKLGVIIILIQVVFDLIGFVI